MKQLLLPSPLPLLLHRPSKPLLLHIRHRRCYAPDAASNGNSGDPSPATSEPSTDTQPAPSTKPPSNPKPTGVKNRLRSRNQARRAQEVSTPPEEVKSKKSATDEVKPKRSGRKEWEEMNLGEKAGELYVGEKGLLFWLNKFAYASIFIMVGGWVLFRFVGPSLGLYQLDAPPLPPTAVFTGSP